MSGYEQPGYQMNLSDICRCERRLSKKKNFQNLWQS